MKTLKTKKVNIVICWNGLKNTAPKDFPNIGEMESTANILENLKEGAGEFVALMEEGEKMNNDIASGKLSGPEAIMGARVDFTKKSTSLEDKTGEEIVDIQFEDNDFNTFFQQFERWGKNWFGKLDTFLAFRKDMNVTNGQPKAKKEQ